MKEAVLSPYILIILFCSIIVLGYFFLYLARKTLVPSPVLLLALGYGIFLVTDLFKISIPDTSAILQIIGTIGLLLIVLEGALDIELTKNRLKTALLAFLSALILFVVSTAAVSFWIGRLTGESFYPVLANAIPISVVSSAIIIPTVRYFNRFRRDFLGMESVFSDIIGILAFDFIILGEGFSLQSGASMLSGMLLSVILSVVFSVLLLFLIQRIRDGVKFFFILSIIVILYSFGKIFLLPSLLLIFLFGILLRNARVWNVGVLARIFSPDKIESELKPFDTMVQELSFFIRTIFFVLFGFSLRLNNLAEPRVLALSAGIIGILYLLRLLVVRIGLRVRGISSLFVAPRGLVTVLLFYSIPAKWNIHGMSDVILLIILVTNLLMMGGVLLHKVVHPRENPEDD